MIVSRPKAFPFGEGGFFNAQIGAFKKTEEVMPQYEFAAGCQQNGTLYCASPAPFGGTLPEGEGFLQFTTNYLYHTRSSVLMQGKNRCSQIGV